MVLDYKFISEEDLIFLLMLLTPEDTRFTLDYHQILNTAREVKGKYVVKLPTGEVRIDKITGEVIQ